MKPTRKVYEIRPLYAVGQSVGLASAVGTHMSEPRGSLRLNGSAFYEILAILPAIGSGPQYRVRSKFEPYDRMVSEYEIVV